MADDHHSSAIGNSDQHKQLYRSMSVMAQGQLDTRALEKASRVEALIEQHQAECAQYRKEVKEQFEKGSGKMDALSAQMTQGLIDQQKTLNRYLITILSGMAICLGYFLMTFGLPGMHR